MAPAPWRETIMSTDDLIASLSQNMSPAPGRAALKRLALGVGAGLMVAAVVMPFWLGVRPDLVTVIANTSRFSWFVRCSNA
jgi:hypothetical protein